MSAQSGKAGISGTSGTYATPLPSGTRLGDYVLGEPLWTTRMAAVYAGRGPAGAATLHVLHAPLAAHPEVRAEVVAGTRAAAALPLHPAIIKTVAAGLTGDILWIATEEVGGLCVAEVLRRKQGTGARGLGAPGAAVVVAAAVDALSAAPHGALTAESMVASRSGAPRLADLALARGTQAAVRLGLVSGPQLAPELAEGPAGPAADVYGLGALLYEALVGRPLERGGPRPSEVAPSLPAQVDEIIARSCHRDPARRFGSAAALGALLGDVLGDPPPAPAPLGRGSAPQDAAAPSLAQTLAADGAPPPSSGDPALALALSDSAEKWLVTKGQLDYGPFSLAEVVAQIEAGKILGSHLIVDKDTGARAEVGQHPLLGPVVDAARARLDEQRRVAAETAHRRTETKRGLLLYVVIGAAVVAVAAGAWWGIRRARTDETAQLVAITGVGETSIDVSVSAPKRPARPPRGKTAARSASGQPASDDQTLDFSADESDDASATLDLDTIHKVYSRQGAALGRCLSGNGGGTANIAFTIDGPSGKVTTVRVNGQSGGALSSCIAKVMRSLTFPAIAGPRTRAEFDISL